MKKKLVSVLVGIMCITAIAGCGSKSSDNSSNVNSDANIEANIEAKVEALDDATTENANTQEEAGEESYVASEEIINAGFGDLMLQIGDDIFMEGGYITFGELLEQYGDKYEITGMTADGILSKGKSGTIKLNKNDSQIVLEASITNVTDDQISAADAVVEYVIPDNDFAQSYTFIPTGMGLGEAQMSYSDVTDMLKAAGYVTCEYGYTNSKVLSGAYIEGDSTITLYATGKDKNLAGTYPALNYAFIIDTSINQVKKIEGYMVKGYNHYFTLEWNYFAGTPISSYSELTDEELNALYEEAINVYSKKEGVATENLKVYCSGIGRNTGYKMTLNGTEYEETQLQVILEVTKDDGSVGYASSRLAVLVRDTYGNVRYNGTYTTKVKETVEKAMWNCDFDEYVIESSLQ